MPKQGTGESQSVRPHDFLVIAEVGSIVGSDAENDLISPKSGHAPSLERMLVKQPLGMPMCFNDTALRRLEDRAVVRDQLGSRDSDRRLRVLIVGPRIGHFIGGQEVQADLLVRLWHKDAFLRVSYLATNLRLPGWVERFPYLRTAVRFPVYLARILLQIRDADVVHVFSGAFSSFLIGSVPAYYVARLLGKKIVINYHSGLAKAHLAKSGIARAVLRGADLVIVPSSYLVDVLKESRIVPQVIANVVDPSLFSYHQRIPLRPVLLCARNLESWYGIDIVLRAFSKIKETFPSARLWVLGEGSQENAIRRLIENLNLTGVEMTGRVPRESIGRFYEEADILINASRVDNMPVSILEAFASGLAVATTNAGGIPYIVHHETTGLVSNMEDVQQLAANVVRLIQDPELACRITSTAYRQSLSYQWNTVRLQWRGAYQGLDSSAYSSPAR